MSGDPKSQGEMNTVFHLRAPPRPLDLISEANLIACGLAPASGEKGIDEGQPVATTTVTALAVQRTSMDTIEVPTESDPPALSAPAAGGVSAQGDSGQTRPIKTVAEPVSGVSAPVGPAFVAPDA